MTDKYYLVLFAMQWLILSHASRPDKAKNNYLWRFFVAAWILTIGLTIYGVKLPW
jgi:hypothetical protein